MITRFKFESHFRNFKDIYKKNLVQQFIIIHVGDHILNKEPKLKNQNKLKKEKPVKIGRILKPILNKICLYCNKEYCTKRETSKFCSTNCQINYNNQFRVIWASKAGKKSVESQKDIKRSKNEKYFAELCIEHFNNVTTNESIFNGWDADVIIHDIKYAVLWNGAWHYKKK